MSTVRENISSWLKDRYKNTKDFISSSYKKLDESYKRTKFYLAYKKTKWPQIYKDTKKDWKKDTKDNFKQSLGFRKGLEGVKHLQNPTAMQFKILLFSAVNHLGLKHFPSLKETAKDKIFLPPGGGTTRQKALIEPHSLIWNVLNPLRIVNTGLKLTKIIVSIPEVLSDSVLASSKNYIKNSNSFSEKVLKSTILAIPAVAAVVTKVVTAVPRYLLTAAELICAGLIELTKPIEYAASIATKHEIAPLAKYVKDTVVTFATEKYQNYNNTKKEQKLTDVPDKSNSKKSGLISNDTSKQTETSVNTKNDKTMNSDNPEPTSYATLKQAVSEFKENRGPDSKVQETVEKMLNKLKLPSRKSTEENQNGPNPNQPSKTKSSSFSR